MMSKDNGSSWCAHGAHMVMEIKEYVSQIRYSLVVILGLNSVSEVQYKGMMTDR